MQYVDSSALVKRYVAEPDPGDAAQLLAADPEWVSSAHTEVEVRRTLGIRLESVPQLLSQARGALRQDWSRTAVVQLDSVTCRLAAELADMTRARRLDALHLAVAQRAGAPALRIVTFDVRMAAVARPLGWSVTGA